jgi:hypothetical protein
MRSVVLVGALLAGSLRCAGAGVFYPSDNRTRVGWSEVIVRGTIVEKSPGYATVEVVDVLMGNLGVERIEIEPNSFRSCTGPAPLFRRIGDRRIFFLRHARGQRYLIYGGPQGAGWAGLATDDPENRTAIAAEVKVAERIEAARQLGKQADQGAAGGGAQAAGEPGTASGDDGLERSRSARGGLGGTKSEEARRAMRAALGDPEESVRVAALTSLKEWARWDSDGELLRLVAARTSDDSVTARFYAADCLGDLLTCEATDILLSMLKNRRQPSHIVDKAVEGLTRHYFVGEPGCRAKVDLRMELLGEAVMNAGQRTASLAIEILRSSASDAAETSLRLLSRKHPKPSVRAKALRYLRGRPDHRTEADATTPGEGEGRPEGEEE